MEATWEERMAAKANARREERHENEWGSPLVVFRSREEAERDWDYCRDCSELRIDGPHGWRTFVTCGSATRRDGCIHGHVHHDGEVWLA